MHQRFRHILTLALLALVVVPATAAAAPGQIYEDCQDGRLDKPYDRKQLREALKDMPTDLDEYTNCGEIIRSAQQGARGAGGAGPLGEGTDNPSYGRLPVGEGGLPLGEGYRPFDPEVMASPEEKRELQRARGGGFQRAGLIPAGSGTRPGQSSGSELPAPLLVLLVLVGAAVIAIGARPVKDLVLRRSA